MSRVNEPCAEDRDSLRLCLRLLSRCSGFTPWRACICEGEALTCQRGTKVNVDGLVATLGSMGHGVEPSTDPGRFVCNYVYYRSLSLTGGVPGSVSHAPLCAALGVSVFVLTLSRLVSSRPIIVSHCVAGVQRPLLLAMCVCDHVDSRVGVCACAQTSLFW
jgi:hypothetical protein